MDRIEVERRAIICFVVAYVISKAWTLLPESDIVHAFFPFNDMQLTLRMHAWFLCKIVEFIIVYYGITILMIHLRTTALIIWVLYVIDILDYSLLYSEPLFYLHLWRPFPVEYGLLKGVSLIAIAGFTVIPWKR